MHEHNELKIIEIIHNSADISVEQKEKLLQSINQKLYHRSTQAPKALDEGSGTVRFFSNPIELPARKKLIESEHTKRGNGKRTSFSLDLSKTRSRSTSITKMNTISASSEDLTRLCSGSESPKISPNSQFASDNNSTKINAGSVKERKSPRSLLSKKALRKNKSDTSASETKSYGMQIPVEVELVKKYIKNYIKTELTTSTKFFYENTEIVALVHSPESIKYYVIDRKQPIGKGNSGEIFTVFDLETQEVLAAKIYKKMDIKYAKIEQSNLILVDRLYGALKCENEYIILQKYFPGVDLLQFMYHFNADFPPYEPNYYSGKRNFSLFTKLKITIGLLEELEFFHSRNLLHRDIKPANIVIDLQEAENNVEITLIDLDSCIHENHKDETFYGSKGYTPPELLKTHECGYLTMQIDPNRISFVSLQSVIGNNHALILYRDGNNDHLYYADKFVKRVLPIPFPENAKQRKELLDEFPEEFDKYKEVNSNNRKKIIKLTGRPLKKLYNRASSIYQCGIIIAELVTLNNYQRERIQLLKDRTCEQEPSLEDIEQIMEDVFFAHIAPNTKTLSIDKLFDNLIHTILSNLAVNMVKNRLKNSSLPIEIQKLKNAESLFQILFDALNNLYQETAIAHASLTTILERISADRHLIDPIVVDPLLEKAKHLFIDIFPIAEDYPLTANYKSDWVINP